MKEVCMNLVQFFLACFLGLLLSGCAQQNLNAPSVEPEVEFPKYSGIIEPINEPLFIPYPYISYKYAIKMDVDIYDKIKNKSAKLTIATVNVIKRTKKEPDSIDIYNGSAAGIGERISFFNCSYTFNTKTQALDSLSCNSNKAETTDILTIAVQEPLQASEAIFFNTIQNGIKTGTVFNRTKSSIPVAEKDIYFDEVVEGISVFRNQKVLVTKINITQDIQKFGPLKMQGYRLYDLKQLYLVDTKIMAFASNEKIALKALVASIPFPPKTPNAASPNSPKAKE